MLKRTLLSLTVICTALEIFTTIAISLDRSDEKVITSEELTQMSELRNKIIQSKYLRFGILDELLDIDSKNVNTIHNYQEILNLENNLVCFYSLIVPNDNSDLKKILKLWKIKNNEINVIMEIDACIKKINENLNNLDSIIKIFESSLI